MSVRAITFNLLHPIHGQNYDEMVMRNPQYNEKIRIDSTTAILKELVGQRREGEILIMALQEVSQMQLESIQREIPARIEFLKVTRIARLKESKRRDGYVGFPSEVAEYEVLLVSGATRVQNVKSWVFKKDTGKGWISVEIPERSLIAVSTHLSFGENRKEQIQDALVNPSGQSDINTTLVMGDFNCPCDQIRKDVISNAGDVVFIQADSATRIGKTGDGPLTAQETLDHFVIYGKQPFCSAVRVYETDVDMISDHRPVEAILDF